MSNTSSRSRLSYLPQTDDDRRAMLAAVGVASVEGLFEQIPESARLGRTLDLPTGLSEQDVVALASGMADRNRHLGQLVCFLGAGAYDHYIPSVVDAVVSRSEFQTAYTPYQPEASQGLLQTIYEYQSMISALTGMEVSNASLYDAATAVGEAAIMASGITGCNRILTSRAVHPHYRQVLATYVSGMGLDVVEVQCVQGLTDLTALKRELVAATACVIVQYPNFLGSIEPLGEIAKIVHERNGLLIASVDPIALGLLKPPGDYGVDIVVGEGQSLGVPIGFGGPFLGLFACRKEHVWHVPGRLVGQTVDADGNRAFTLTLQTREQHIRRERATSNICTNQALAALAATAYLAALGKNGLRHVAGLCYHKSHYAADQISRKNGYSLAWQSPFFKEFVIRCEKPVSEIRSRLLEKNILGGLDLGVYYPELEGHMLLCVTEKRSKADIDSLVEALP